MKQLIVGLKIETYKSFSECAKIIRQFHNYSFSELKKRIENHDYILCYDCTDAVGVKNIISCYDKLVELGTEVSLYELDHRPSTIELIRNRNHLYDEISDEIDSAGEL